MDQPAQFTGRPGPFGIGLVPQVQMFGGVLKCHMPPIITRAVEEHTPEGFPTLRVGLGVEQLTQTAEAGIKIVWVLAVVLHGGPTCRNTV